MPRTPPDISELLDQFINDNNLYSNEGRRGVEKLCQIAAAIGYKDPMYFGQLTAKATIGDLICMLEDNPGMIESMLEWLGRGGSDEWKESLASQLGEVDSDHEEDEE